ncbi:hypothetical protein [Candidatus Nitrososphaera gargensis]|nr:hypothetical protein [Candidatus Nitrososphaera gargensis]
MAQQWAIRTYNTYENLSEYSQTKLEHYKTQANKEFSSLIDDISGKLTEVDDKVKWVITFVNPMERLVLHLEQNILPLITSGSENQLADIRPYLLKLTTYFLAPSEELLKELLPSGTSSIESISTSTGLRMIDQNIHGGQKLALPQKHVIIMGLSVLVGIGVYFLAIFIEVDKSSAFLGSVTLAGALIGGYLAYTSK